MVRSPGFGSSGAEIDQPNASGDGRRPRLGNRCHAMIYLAELADRPMIDSV